MRYLVFRRPSTTHLGDLGEAASGWWVTKPGSAVRPGAGEPTDHRPRPQRTSSTIWAAPRSWVEKVYPNFAYFNEVDRGGHFAAWEEPELFSAEVRAAFSSLR